MADERQLEILNQGVDVWNDWRGKNPGVVVDLMNAELNGKVLSSVNLKHANLIGAELNGADLSEADLREARLNVADLSTANLLGANLSGAYLLFVHLNGADLAGADLSGAYLEKADMQETHLYKANLSGANLTDASLIGADLTGVDITGATLIGANLGITNVTDIIYDLKSMAGKYKGICVDSCFGYAVFKRDAQDQDYIDTLWANAKNQCPLYDRITKVHTWFIELWAKWVGCKWLPLFKHIHNTTGLFCGIKHRRQQPLQIIGIWLWGFLTDYGRSIPRLSLVAAMVIAGFGYYYQCHPELVNINAPVQHSMPPASSGGSTLNDYLFGTPEPASTPAMSGFTPYYFSVVIFTTLGLGDISPHGTGGQLAVISEVVLGYVTLGLLLSILGNKVARRS
ncbi:MAG: pentapeptide repeat-containing protein [Armatimonadota bacterium]